MRNATIILCLCLLASTAQGQSTLGVFADSLGTDCNIPAPYPGGSVTAYVVAQYGDAGDCPDGAGFRIQGVPVGWSATVVDPDPVFQVVLGDPFGDGIQMVSPTCLTGRRVLFTLSITPSGPVENVTLVPISHATAIGIQACGFEGELCPAPCPFFCTFNGFGYDCNCFEPVPTTLNGDPCSVAIEETLWGEFKRKYEPVTRSGQ